MLKEASIIEDWVREGEALGEAHGRRAATLDMLRAKFGELPPSVVQRVEGADAEWCRMVTSRVLTAQSTEQLGL